MVRSRYVGLLVYATFFLFQLPIHASQPLVTLRLSELNVTAAEVGVMIGLSGILPALIAIPAGRLTDRIGAAMQAAIGGVVCIVGFVGLSLAASPWLVVVYTALVGFGQTVGVVAYQSFVAASDMIENRVQAFGWLAAIIAIVQSIGPASAGFLADRYSLTAVFSIAAILLVFSLLGPPVLNAHKRKSTDKVLDPVTIDKNWWRHSSLPFAVAVTLLFALSYNVRLSYLPIYLEGVGFSVGQIGILFSVQAIGSLVIRSQIGRISDWLGQRQTLAVAFATSVPVLLLIPFLSEFNALMVAGLILGAGNGIMHPVTLAVATVSVPRERHGTALGVRYATFRLGFVVSPMILAVAVAMSGLPSAFFCAAALAGVGAFHSWRTPASWAQS